jgi:hypothetical protein
MTSCVAVWGGYDRGSAVPDRFPSVPGTGSPQPVPTVPTTFKRWGTGELCWGGGNGKVESVGLDLDRVPFARSGGLTAREPVETTRTGPRGGKGRYEAPGPVPGVFAKQAVFGVSAEGHFRRSGTVLGNRSRASLTVSP